MARRAWKLVLVAGLTFLGCKTTERQVYRPFEPCSPSPCESAALAPKPLPPGGPLEPMPAPPMPGAGIQPGAPNPSPSQFPPDTRQSFAPPRPSPQTDSWRPLYEPGVRLLTPEPLSPDAVGRAEQHSSTPSPSPLPSVTPPPVTKIPAPEKDKDRAVSSLPVGIAHFTELKPDSVSTGFRPHPTDGIPWLQDKGYRCIIYLRSPGVSDVNDRRLIERHGLKYQSLEVAPDTLSRELVARLSDIIAETGNTPLFVYDKDGTCTGALFYLYLRLYDNMSDEQARVRAAQLGLKDDEAQDNKAWWAAIQKVLQQQ